MKTKIFTFIVIVCSYAATAQINGSFTHGGIAREYILHVPPMYTGTTAVPLILNLHGYTSNNSQQQLYTQFDQVADTANFIVVYPNGTFDNQNQRFWNGFGLPQPDDVGFLSALIDTIDAHYNINLNRVYSTGMSNGGIMSYSLACNLSHRITAVASVTGSMVPSVINSCSPTHPVPVMEIHGTADGTVPYNGGNGLSAIPTVLDYWTGFNNCNAVPDSADVPDTDPGDGCTARHYVWNGGDMGSTVEHYKIIGGAHTWPDAVIDIDVTNHDFSANNEIWRFFNKYTLFGLTTAVTETPAAKVFTVYPNPSNSGFTLRFAGEGKKTVTILNTMGQVISSFSFTGSQTQLNIEIPGLYFVSVTESNKVWSEKIVKN